MIVHLVVGDEAARPLREAVAAEPSIAGEVVVLQDILHVGPLRRPTNEVAFAPELGRSFGALRGLFWTDVTAAPEPVKVPDEERAVAASNHLHKFPGGQVWFWMAPGPADVCAWYWLLGYLGQHTVRFHIVNIAGLPFLTEEGKLFFPRNISELTARELIKARRLARPVTAAEVEIDGDIWKQLVEEDAPLRTLEGGKKIVSRPVDHYDATLLAACNPTSFSKAARVINTAISKGSVPTGDVWLAHRIKKMAAEGKLQVRGDTSRSPREWDVALPGDKAAPPDTTADTANA